MTKNSKKNVKTASKVSYLFVYHEDFWLSIETSKKSCITSIK